MREVNWQSLWPMLVFGVVLLTLFWVVIVRPAQVQQRRHRDLIEGLTVGGRSVTAGGIYGTIVRLGTTEVGIEVADGVVITFDRRAVRRVLD